MNYLESIGLSLWSVYMGEGQVFHFGVGDENVTQKACRSFLQMMIPKSSNDSILKKTRIRTQPITEIKVPQETQIRVELKYDLVNFNTEHFATFVQYSHAVFTQISFKKKNQAHQDTTQNLEMIMQQRVETET
ncbi:ubiquitin-conjugating enzyme E2 S [Sarotherodon galilaeus]